MHKGDKLDISSPISLQAPVMKLYCGRMLNTPAGVKLTSPKNEMQFLH
jgi:hypothetical protein